MMEKRKFKVLLFNHRGIMDPVTHSFEEVMKGLRFSADDFEREHVFPFADREAAKRRITAEKYDLVLVCSHLGYGFDVVNEFCFDWNADQLGKVVLWQVGQASLSELIPRLRACLRADFVEDDFADGVEKISRVLAAAKR